MLLLLQVLGAAEHHATQAPVRGLDYLDSDHPEQVPSHLKCICTLLEGLTACHLLT